ncbi:MAG: hypothetical protein AB8V23_05685 [Candidatus Midichloria sp.]|uniref:Uncharacterized protein n=1 Tax=Hyalomma marginatum TaxID=34627 RepID=A0A8S4C183_9ACAR|nr:hypothetical protein MHYMCMPASI_00022 [Hyalomma marginatum]CAG7599044.1 hypothetical protein MHYMCMPSP_01175 [Hyalomma marginatum]
MSDIFALAANYNAGNNTADVAIGDFNHDGKTDITLILVRLQFQYY